ncbi:CBS domain-containing protein [Candidatus Bathyarchaeota archaeon]|nr:MAG: CBS domain-containing protein [Candidatus Bathyarchaeota archaeon]
MMTRDLMLKDVVTIKGNVPAKEAIELLFKRHIGCIVVINDAEQCIGIFTERDVIRVVAQNMPLDAPIEKIMTKNPLTINEDSIFQEAKSVIISAKIRHLPVIDANGKLIGLISVRHILDELSGL